MAKMQRPVVMIEDLRFGIGSIEITGPESTKALLGVLEPVEVQQGSTAVPKSPSQVWS